MFKNVSRKCRQNRGFTLMEVMVVVAILAVVVLIAVPSVIKMRQNMKFAERNDYAKSIYMAAQSNLTQMRSMGELGLLENAATSAQSQTGDAAGTPPSSYFYTWKDDTTFFDLVLPANSIDSTIRDDQIIIEYNPKAGIVYSVFYYDGNDMDIVSKYKSHELTRVEEARKEMQLGYYSIGQVDALSDDALKVYQIGSTVSYKNGQEALLTLVLPTQAGAGTPEQIIPDDASHNHYMTNLEVNLIISGENGNSFNTIVKPKGVTTNCSIVASTGEGGTGANMVHITIPLDSLKTDGSFVKIANNIDTNNLNKNIVPAGDNISITAEVTFYPDADDPIVMIESATIAGINPMYHSLTPNPKFDTAPNAQNTEKPYILAISNGRHLQNLSYLDAEFAQNIESIVFTQQAEDPVQPENGSTEGSTSESQPANGAKTSTNTGSQENNTPTDLVLNWQDTVDAYSSTLTFHPIELRDFSYVPSILGNGVKIQNLTVSSAVDGNAGLFAALKNTSVEKITLENPIVNATGATSTGALIGTAENVSISDCDVITKNTGDTIHYYISGQGDVGGLIGTATGTGSTNTISNCSSVAIVRSADGSKSNVGGLVGSSDGTDYTNCDSSATVRGGTFVTDATNTYSYLGGLVGLAKNAEFSSTSSSASVKGTPSTDSQGAIIDVAQKNYIGGLIGRAESCDFVSNVNANLTDLPAYAYGAGGLVGWMKGGRIFAAGATLTNNAETTENTVVRFGGLAAEFTDGVTIATDQNQAISVNIKGDLCGDSAAGAIVGISGSFCVIENIEVTIDGAIRGSAAAGFAIEAGGKIDNCSVDSGAEENLISLGEKTSTGFVTTNRALITNSYVRGSVKKATDGAAAGFVFTNEGSINCSMANVEVGDNHAFVNTNGGSIKNCYGWLWGNDSTSALRISNNCTYSYFVNGTAAQSNANAMVLYEAATDGTASQNITDTEALSDGWAVDILNEGTPENGTAAWEEGSHGYQYPQLVALSHKGSSSKPATGSYAYALRYVEDYGSSEGEVLMKFNSDGSIKEVTAKNLSPTSTGEIAYYLCCRTNKNLNNYKHLDRNDGDAFKAELSKFGLGNTNELYTIYKLSASQSYEAGNVKVSTYYPLYNANGDYRIRTNAQYENIPTDSKKTFYLDGTITLTSTLSSFNGTMKDTDSAAITAEKSLVDSLSGTLSGLTVTGLTEPMVGTVKGDGEIENCTLTEVNIPSGENVGAFAGTLEGGTISGGSAEGSVSGSNYVGGAIGYVKSGTVTGVTNVNVAVSATGENTKAGMFVGYADGGSFSNCKSTATTTTLPFGILKATTQTVSATHSSIHNHAENDYSVINNKWIAVDKLQEDGSPVSVTLSTIDVDISNCFFNTDEPALKKPLYYYQIDQEASYAKNQLVAFFAYINRDTQTYDHFLPSTAESMNKWNAFDYYIRANNSGSYHKLYVKVEEKKQTTTTDGETITDEFYEFSFGYDNSGTKTSIKTVTVTDPSETIPDDVYLYIRNDTQIPTEGNYEEGKYVLYSGLGYLTFNSETGEFEWKVDFTRSACIDNIAELELSKNDSLNIDYALIYHYTDGDSKKTVPCDLYTFSATKHVKPVGHSVEINYPT